MELLFRAWHKELKIMSPHFGLKHNMPNFDPGLPHIIVMMYCGLKGKQGQKLFTDDLVEHYGEVFRIGFERGCFMLFGLSTRVDESGEDYRIGNELVEGRNEHLETIGTVHANPEIIKELA